MGARTRLSLEEFMALPDDGNKYELNHGELVVMPAPTFEHIRIVRQINRILSKFVDEQRLGEVYSEAGCLLFREPETTYRQPDVAFLSRNRIAAMSPGTFLAGAPELTVEVVSPSNSAQELNLKVEEYQTAGGREVWIVYPKTRSVHIYQPGKPTRILRDHDAITFDLFPGWSACVSDFFDLDY